MMDEIGLVSEFFFLFIFISGGSTGLSHQLGGPNPLLLTGVKTAEASSATSSSSEAESKLTRNRHFSGS